MKRRHLEVLHNLLVTDKNQEFRICVGLSMDKGNYIAIEVGQISLNGEKVTLPSGTRLYKKGIGSELKRDKPFIVLSKCSSFSFVENRTNRGYLLKSLAFAPALRNPVIKQSGKTYVARYQGVGYLCMRPHYYKDVKPGANLNSILEELQQVSLWKPFGDVTITDEIALLRPMVVVNNSTYYLLAVKAGSSVLCKDDVNKFHYADPYIPYTRWVRLASVKDLEDK